MGGDTHDASYYFKCMIGGLLACGLTHTAICPLDVVKCRRQVDPTLYKSLGEGLKIISKEYGVFNSRGGLITGWGPTFVGYSAQGLGKFGFYEIFKDVYKAIVGDENAVKYRRIGWSVASGTAEIIADTLLCPWEAVKVRTQTSKVGTFPLGFGEAFAKLRADEGIAGLYKGLGPLWASYLAGIFCAIVSHPADTIVSKLYSIKSSGSLASNVGKIYSEVGFAGLWRGLGTRILMIGTLTGLQWYIYDSFKTAVGLQASGGAPAPTPAKKH